MEISTPEIIHSLVVRVPHMTIQEEKRAGYITLKEASERFGYSPDYLGQLIRKGKIEGKQVYSHVAWVTTPEAIEAYLAGNVRKKSGVAEVAIAQMEDGMYSDVNPVDLHDEEDDDGFLSPRATTVLLASFRALFVVVIFFAMFVFYVLTSAFGSELRGSPKVASAAVVFGTTSASDIQDSYDPHE